MKTQVASTSLATYRVMRDPANLNHKEQIVMELMKRLDARPMTREQIAHHLGWKEASVCGRCNALVAKGELIELPGGVTTSGRPAKLLRVPVVMFQGGLFQ